MRNLIFAEAFNGCPAGLDSWVKKGLIEGVGGGGLETAPHLPPARTPAEAVLLNLTAASVETQGQRDGICNLGRCGSGADRHNDKRKRGKLGKEDTPEQRGAL